MECVGEAKWVNVMGPVDQLLLTCESPAMKYFLSLSSSSSVLVVFPIYVYCTTTKYWSKF